jgi:taurine dioxygenase
MKTRKLSDVLGAELVDFDIKRPSNADEQAELRSLFCEHHLLLVRGQDATEADQDRFTQYFGPLSLMREGLPAGHISNKEEVKREQMVVTGQNRLLWHADGTYGIHPGIGTSLLAIDAAKDATPTMYVNAVRALERMPSALRARVEGLKARHYRETYHEQTSKRMREEDLPRDAPPDRYPFYEHPIVYPLPHSDKKVLFVNELATSHVVGIPRDESEALIQQLFSRLYAEDQVYTHRWQPKDVVIWDNLALQHCRPNDLGTSARHLRRLSLDGWNTGQGVMDWFASGTVRARTAA